HTCNDFFLHSSPPPPDLPSFPTRRSSDLAVALASRMRSRCCGLPDRKRSLPAFICWMISSAVILSRCSLVRSAWANTLPKLASTTPTAVATPAALQKPRRSNRFLPSLNCEYCIVALLHLHLSELPF